MMIAVLLSSCTGTVKTDSSSGFPTIGDSGGLDTAASDTAPADETAVDETAVPADTAAGLDTGDDKPTGPVDSDGDGYTDDVDCDDEDDTVYPGAEELDDGKDQDCDDVADDIEVCIDGTGEYPNIQGAIDNAPSGWTILLCPGDYEESLSVTERPVTIQSMEGPDVTTLSPDWDSASWGSSGPTIALSGVPSPGLGIVGMTLHNASNAGAGGAVRCSYSALWMTGNVIVDNTAEDGGGVYAWGCDEDIDGNLFESNTATIMGGAIVSTEFYGAISNNTFTYNQAGDDGGAIYVYYGAGEISDNAFYGSYSANDGGAVYLNQTNGTVVEGNLFSGNNAADDGGGLRVYVSYVTVHDNEFSENTAADDGGCVKFSHYESEFTDNTLEGCVAGDRGGGLELDNDASTVSGNTFTDNQAAYGAGLHSAENEGSMSLTRNTFTGNVATACGGAIALESDPYPLSISKSEFTENEAPYGGAVCALSAVVDIENVLLVDNSASTAGGAVYGDDVAGRLTQSTVYGSYSPTGGAFSFSSVGSLAFSNNILSSSVPAEAVYLSGSLSSWTYTDVYGGGFSGMSDPAGINGNISEAPAFTDATLGDFTLQSSSPCVDAGDPSVLDSDGSTSDMGAFGGPHGAW